MDDYEKRQEEAKEILRERLEPHRKAVKIVERLMEKCVDKDFFKSCANFLMPSNYADAVEERSLDKLCGYPLCDKPMEEIPTQRYHISMKTNKVYDMSERKFFCSQSCYKASKYYQAQVPDSPLWSRHQEKSVEVKLLEEGGTLTPKEEPNDNLIESLQVTEKEIECPPKERETIDDADDLAEDLSLMTLHDSRAQRKRYQEFERREMELEKEKETKMKPRREDGTVENEKERVSSKSREKITAMVARDDRQDEVPIKTSTKESQKQSKKQMNPETNIIVHHVGQCLMEWRTIESVNYLNNSNESTEVASVNRVGNLQSDQTGGNNTMEAALAADQFKENEGNEGEVLTYAASKPVPEIDQLRKETDLFQLKVRQFYSLRPDKLQPSVDAKDKKTKVSKEGKQGSETGSNITLPPVDSKSQMLIRRKLFLDKMHKVLRDLLPTLGMSTQDINADLHDLVMTLNLGSHNISFKPAGWTLVSLCLLHVLAARRPKVQRKLSTPHSVAFLAVIWKQYGICEGEVGNLVRRFMNGCQKDTAQVP